MGNKMTDKEIVGAITSICIMYELERYTAEEAMRLIYKVLTEEQR